MAKKPKHDPLTAWSSTSAGSPLTYTHLQQAYQYLTAPMLSLAPASAVTGYAQPSMAWPTPPKTNAYGKTIKWAEMKVGESAVYDQVDFEGADEGGITETEFSPFAVRLDLSDGSAGEYAYSLQSPPIITKTKDGSPMLVPDEIEETTELIIGWRTFSVEHFKLRGVWAVWHERVFHASCNCQEFQSATQGFSYFNHKFETKDELREQMRQHLAAGRGTCGVYSRCHLELGRDVTGRDRRMDRATQVAAKVVNYGIGYEYDGGFRSEYSRLEHLYLLETRPVSQEMGTGELHVPVVSDVVTYQPETVAQTLSTTYGIPCDVMHPFEFMWKHEEGML